MSKNYRGSRVVIYPVYLDAGASRKGGRKVPKSLALRNPSIEIIARAAELLGLDPLLELDKSHPRNIERAGRVLVKKANSKAATLKMIARKCRELASSTKPSSPPTEGGGQR